MATPFTPKLIARGSDVMSRYSNALTSQPGLYGGGTGQFSSFGAPTGMSQTDFPTIPDYYQETRGTAGTPASADFRQAYTAGTVIPSAQLSSFDPSEYVRSGLGTKASPYVYKANALAQRGTAAVAPSADYGAFYTSAAAQAAATQGWQAQQEALLKTAENRNRGNTILAGYDQNIANNRGISDQMLAMNQGYGASMRQQLDNDYRAALAQSNQSAIRRGLGNTTIRDSLNRGVTSNYNLSRMQLGDQLTQRNIGLLGEGIGRENQGNAQRLGFLSSIQNDYPTSADIGNYYLQAPVLQETLKSRTGATTATI
jgi:hypothetical protein